MDLIKRSDALKDKLQQHHDFYVMAWGGFGKMPIGEKKRVDEITNCIAEVVNAPTIEPKQGEWIPCSERLPARQGYYICTCKDSPRVLKTTTIKWSNGWQLSGTRAYWKVIAWMPLPAPWEGADDER